MKKCFSALLFILLSSLTFAQSSEVISEPEVEATFPGGASGLMKYISENVKYPEDAVKNGIHGKVYLSYIIEKNGQVSNVEVKRGVDKELDDEAIRVISSMPKWTPASNRGKAVRSQILLPINFSL
jgi:protein TonB